MPKFVTQARIDIVHQADSEAEAYSQTAMYLRRMLDAIEDGVITLNTSASAGISQIIDDPGLTILDLPENQF